MIDVMERTKSGETVVNGSSEIIEVNKIAKTVNILGTEYKIIEKDYNDTELKGKNRQGYCFFTAREIVIADLSTDDDWGEEPDYIKIIHRSEILRHEITHAFLYESGLLQNSAECGAWAINEEMVDWFAIQSPKIFKAFQEVGCL